MVQGCQRQNSFVKTRVRWWQWKRAKDSLYLAKLHPQYGFVFPYVSCADYGYYMLLINNFYLYYFVCTVPATLRWFVPHRSHRAASRRPVHWVGAEFLPQCLRLPQHRCLRIRQRNLKSEALLHVDHWDDLMTLRVWLRTADSESFVSVSGFWVFLQHVQIAATVNLHWISWAKSSKSYSLTPG